MIIIKLMIISINTYVTARIYVLNVDSHRMG